jgi:hypothetical protein
VCLIDLGALLGALNVSLYWGNAVGIVGASSSDESEVAAIVSSVYQMPMISYASTAALLSNKSKFKCNSFTNFSSSISILSQNCPIR